MKPINGLPPFKRFCVTIGNLPSSYVDSMSYYECLMWLCKYLKDTVIPAVNENAEAVNELINWFNNLDVQDEIDKKLDEMVESGQLQEIISEYLNSKAVFGFDTVNDMINATNLIDGSYARTCGSSVYNNGYGELYKIRTITNDDVVDGINIIAMQTDDTLIAEKIKNAIIDEVDEKLDEVDTITDEIRKNYYNKYNFLSLPSSFNTSFFNRLKIYESIDKKNYKYSIDIDSLKNSGGSSIYVDCNYTGTSSGTSEQPYKTLQDGFAHASDGDTIYVKTGIYHRESLPSTTQTKNNVNIICDDGVIFTHSSALTWSQNSTYTNVYQASRTNSVSACYVKDGNPIKLKTVNSLESCASTLGSYYNATSTVYVNIGEEVTNNNTIIELATGVIPLNIVPNSKNMKIYMENAICLNAGQPSVYVSNTNDYTCEFNAYKCKFLYGSGHTYSGLSCLGANVTLVECEASENENDGFNYHLANGVPCYAIEINCKAVGNGAGSENTYNGSTIHDGGKIIRINGNYLLNKGGNVADVHQNTMSINIQCNAIDSTANTENLYCTDFVAQQSGTIMYLYNCYSKGNSYKNIWAVDGSTIYVSNCKYDSIEGNVEIVN